MENCFIFIGNIKQCSRQFSIELPGNTTLLRQGSQLVLVLIDNETSKTELVTISWVTRNWQFFVAITCRIREGEGIFRKCLHQLNKSGWVPPNMAIIEVDQPKAMVAY